MLKTYTAAEFFESRRASTWMDDPELNSTVAEILAEIRERGDEALEEYTARFDGIRLPSGKLAVTEEEMKEAAVEVERDFLDALCLAAKNIERFHREARSPAWTLTDRAGSFFGELKIPLERVGIYVPGGTAAYPSSVLMNAIPARVAGVKEIICCTPPGPEGRVNPYVLAAAAEVGVKRIFRLGGVQAIGAMAYGTETVPKVDKITGPGNRYVTIAKKLVFGTVDIDMLAGPSEVVVLADESARAEWVASDLLAQAEHDPDAVAILVTTSDRLCRDTIRAIKALYPSLPRREIIEKSLRENGAAVLVEDLEEGIEVVNRIAPEHLEVVVREPFACLGRFVNAGAIFLGPYSPQSTGDYAAGPNHILPTGGTARFFSPLGVEDFIKRSSVVYYTDEGLARVAKACVALAQVEGLEAHAQAVRVRRGGIRS